MGGPGGGFAQWYAVYPLHVGRKGAEKAYDKAIREGIDPAVLLAAAQAYRDNARRTPQFTAYPTTWLNQGRWDDDPNAAEIDRLARIERLGREIEGMGEEMDGPA